MAESGSSKLPPDSPSYFERAEAEMRRARKQLASPEKGTEEAMLHFQRATVFALLDIASVLREQR